MTSRIWTKPETQETIKALREAGYIVAKRNQGYAIVDDDTGEVWKMEDGGPLFQAMTGPQGYLVRYADELFGDQDV